MGNVHVTAHRLGHREREDAALIPVGDDNTLESHDGMEPAQLVLEVDVDHKAKLSSATFRWIAVSVYGIDGESLVIEVSMPVTLQHLKSHVTLPRPWPPGDYRVDVLVGGETIGSVPFRIRGDARRARFANPVLTYRVADEAPALPFDDDNSVTKDAGTLLVLFVAENIIDVGRASISWIAENVVGAAPETTIAAKELPPGRYNEFAGSLFLPRAFPVGTYRCELHVDGHHIQNAHFRVRE